MLASGRYRSRFCINFFNRPLRGLSELKYLTAFPSDESLGYFRSSAARTMGERAASTCRIGSLSLFSHSRELGELRFLFGGDPLTLQLSTVIEVTDKFPIDQRPYQGDLAIRPVEHNCKLPIFPDPG